MPGLYPNPSAGAEAFQPGDQVRWYVGDTHISPYIGVVKHTLPKIHKVDVDFPVGGVKRMSPEDLILVTRMVGESTSVPNDSDYSSYDKDKSDKDYGTMSQNFRDMTNKVVSKKSSGTKKLASVVAEKFASDVVDKLASDVAACLSTGLSDVEAYQSIYSKYASKCSDVFLRSAVRKVYAALSGNLGLPLPKNYKVFEDYLEDLKVWLGVDSLSQSRISEEKRRFSESKSGTKGNIGLPIPKNYSDFDDYLEALKSWLGVDNLSQDRISEEKKRFDKLKAGN